MNRSILLTVAAVLGTGAAASAAQASVITDWDFGAVAATSPDNTPAPTTGSGTAQSLGMTNTYSYSGGVTGATTLDDVTNDGATASQTGSTLGNGDVWRIRGQNPGNGWNNAAPEYSQGAQFDVSTVGYSGIDLSFNWASTTQGIGNLQVQYNLNTSNASGWTNIGPLESAKVDNGTPGATGYGFQTDTISLAGISGVSNDADFGIRLVSAYNPTLGDEYASAISVVGGSPVQYNNSSGNWRIADVQIDGTASPVPLPAAFWLLLSGLGGFGAIARRRGASCSPRVAV